MRMNMIMTLGVWLLTSGLAIHGRKDVKGGGREKMEYSN